MWLTSMQQFLIIAALWSELAFAAVFVVVAVAAAVAFVFVVVGVLVRVLVLVFVVASLAYLLAVAFCTTCERSHVMSWVEVS